MANIFKSAVLRTSQSRPQPTMFSLPGLNQQPLHDRANFPWVKSLEAAVPSIQQEYLDAVKKAPVSDYDTAAERPDKMLHSGGWNWHSLISAGRKQGPFRELCPNTTAH